MFCIYRKKYGFVRGNDNEQNEHIESGVFTE